MKFRTYVIYCLLLGTLLSCNKDDEMVVTLKTSGNLSMNITDGNGKAVTNTSVRLYGYFDSYTLLLNQQKTDDGGSINFGELNQGTYGMYVDTTRVEGILYNPSETFQIISGSNKQITVNVKDYIGTLNFTFKKYSYETGAYDAYSGLNMLLVPENLYQYNSELSYYINNAEYIDSTDSSGKVSFVIPSSRYFYIIVYGENSFNVLGYASVSKGSNSTYSMTLDGELKSYGEKDPELALPE